MVTQTPSSYEGEGEGLNFNGEVELNFERAMSLFSKKGKRSVFCFGNSQKCRIGQT